MSGSSTNCRGAKDVGEIVAQEKGPKIVVFKMKPQGFARRRDTGSPHPNEDQRNIYSGGFDAHKKGQGRSGTAGTAIPSAGCEGLPRQKDHLRSIINRQWERKSIRAPTRIGKDYTLFAKSTARDIREARQTRRRSAFTPLPETRETGSSG
jgi:hypothetical protein